MDSIKNESESRDSNWTNLSSSTSKSVPTSASPSTRLKRVELGEKEARIEASNPTSIQLNQSKKELNSIKTQHHQHEPNPNEHLDGISTLLSPPSLHLTPASPIFKDQNGNGNGILVGERETSFQFIDHNKENPFKMETAASRSSENQQQPSPIQNGQQQQTKTPTKLNLNLFRKKSKRNHKGSISPDEADAINPPPIPISNGESSDIASTSVLKAAPIQNSLVSNFQKEGLEKRSKSKGSKGKGKERERERDQKPLPETPGKEEKVNVENHQDLGLGLGVGETMGEEQKNEGKLEGIEDRSKSDNNLKQTTSNSNSIGFNHNSELQDQSLPLPSSTSVHSTPKSGAHSRLTSISSETAQSQSPSQPSHQSPSQLSVHLPQHLKILTSASHLQPEPGTLGLNPGMNSSESWLNPADSEGSHIRKTYAHFDKMGVEGDGFEDGREFTRERTEKAAWEMEEAQQDRDRDQDQGEREGDETITQKVENDGWVTNGNGNGFGIGEKEVEVLKTPTSPFGFFRKNQGTGGNSRPTTPMKPPVSSEDFRKFLDLEKLEEDPNGRSSSRRIKGDKKQKEETGSIFRNQSQSKKKSKNQHQDSKTKDLEISSVLANGITAQDAISTSLSEESNSSPDHLEMETQRQNGVISQNSLFPPTPRSNASHSSGRSQLTEAEVTMEERIRQKQVIEKKREEFLGKVDRFGFFSRRLDESLHGRTAILLSSAYLTFPSLKPSKTKSTNLASNASSLINSPSLSLMSNTSSVNPNSNQSTSATTIESISAIRTKNEEIAKGKESERMKKWGKMLKVKERDQGMNALNYGFQDKYQRNKKFEVDGINSSPNEEKLRRRVYKGIPDPWRSAVWGALIDRLDDRVETQRIKQASRYPRLLTRPSSYDVQIDLDVPRTISGHISFHTRYGQGQRSLFHLLHAFSLFCKDCGYCQGMGPIAATLLCYFGEEKAYSILCSLHGSIPSEIPSTSIKNSFGLDLHSTFSPGFPGVVENFFVQESLLNLFLPSLAFRFKEEGISTSAYATRWYITLFANSLPFSLQLRLWDCLFYEGKDFLVVFSIAVIWGLKDRLISENWTFEKILENLSSFLVPENDESLLEWCRVVMGKKDVRKQIEEIRKEWKGLVESGEAMSRLT